MIIQPKVRGFMCTTAHPEGCAANVDEQIAYVKQQGIPSPSLSKPASVLVLGASTGYGLASRISAAFGCGAATLGVFFEKPSDGKRTASAGWYNSTAFHKRANDAGLYAKSINGDAFSHALKQQVINTIKQDLGQVDMVIYSLAAPRRVHPDTQHVFKSTLKPVLGDVTATTLDTDKKEVKTVSLPKATEEEIAGTVGVMGGEDWQMWIEALHDAGVLAKGCQTTAYTYIGEKITHDIYWDGTIGAAKKDLDQRVISINKRLQLLHGRAHVSVLKAVVTQASSAIPIMPLYLALLFKVMKAKSLHEGCIEQVHGLFNRCLLQAAPEVDDDNRWRMDQKELRQDVQDEVIKLWPQVTTENIDQLTDFAGYQAEFLKLFGFGVAGIDYSLDVDPVVIASGIIQA